MHPGNGMQHSLWKVFGIACCHRFLHVVTTSACTQGAVSAMFSLMGRVNSIVKATLSGTHAAVTPEAGPLIANLHTYIKHRYFDAKHVASQVTTTTRRMLQPTWLPDI